MWWLALWVVLTAISALGVLVTANSVRFGRRVAREVRDMWAGSAEARRIEHERLEALPGPVRRYLNKALGRREIAPRTVRLRHGGTFRPSLDGNWLRIRGEQYFAADPPGFVWWGRVLVAPGLWIEARDRSVGGAGNMFIVAESTVTLANSVGPELDQGGLLRLLGEMMWFPTALLDDRYVRWSAVDDRRAGATLNVGGREVAGTFEFGEDGLPALFTADRYRDVGGGQAVLTRFSGRSSDYREVDGLLVPHRVVAAWHVDGQESAYAAFEVERLEFDATAPF
jgi:hypothetical protein